jgi:riboflavin kinase/FMN adenylyltransferase
MRLEEELASITPEKDMCLTIGVFDGVHLGHKYLISQLKDYAQQHNLLSGVITFRQHPREVLSPRVKLPYLTNLAEKVRLLKLEGVDSVIALSFSWEMAGLGARKFVELLKKYLRLSGLVIGPDFALGRGREGNNDALRELGEEMSFSVTIVAPFKTKGEVVSSTAIRKALAEGDMKRATALIGRLFSLQGRVTAGDRRGASLGYPTVNLDVEPKQALPADGVYATWVCIDDQAYQSMTNIGWRPTFNGRGRTVETYIVNYEGSLYGQELRIDFVERLRDEKRFDRVEELKKQVAEDVRRGMAILSLKGRD